MPTRDRAWRRFRREVVKRMGVMPMKFNPYVPDFTSWPEQSTGTKRGNVSRGT